MNLGESGEVVIDSFGDRASSLQLRNVVTGPKYQRVGNYFKNSDSLEILNSTKIIWPGGSTKPPLGRPICGFNKEFCPEKEPTGFIISFHFQVLLDSSVKSYSLLPLMLKISQFNGNF